MSYYVHHVPGRLRIRNKAFKNDDANAAAVSSLLQDLPGVREIELNRLTGSLLVRYDKAELSSSKILGLLAAERLINRVPDLERRVRRAELPPGFREHAGRRLLAAVPRIIAEAVIEKLVQRAALALVAAVV